MFININKKIANINEIAEKYNFKRYGQIIAFEGIDGSGKTTQINKIIETLNNYNVIKFSFPDRQTTTGKIINDFLSLKNSNNNMNYISMLFALNRLEKKELFEKLMFENKIILLDRYKYSGFAYSIISGIDINWLKEIDKYNIEADLIIFFNVDNKIIDKINKGVEIYEKSEILKKVNKNFNNIFSSYNNVIKINYIDNIDEMFKTIYNAIINYLENNNKFIYIGNKFKEDEKLFLKHIETLK